MKEYIIELFNTVDELNKTIKFIKEEGYSIGVVFYTLDSTRQLIIYHITNYKQIPDQLNIDNNISELSNDPDFKLDKEVISNIKYIIIELKDIKIK